VKGIYQNVAFITGEEIKYAELINDFGNYLKWNGNY
jgi:hypothetical protein